MFLGLSIALIVAFADQLSKFLVREYFTNTASPFEFGGFFNLVEAWNTGVSFSMFDGGGLIGIIILSAFAIGVIIFLLLWLKKENNNLIKVALGMIIGGAIGNVVDRIYFGAVYDFLDFHYKNLHWPAFNVADSFISIGAFIIIIHSLLNVNSCKKEGLK